jgi:hypothetical protein
MPLAELSSLESLHILRSLIDCRSQAATIWSLESRGVDVDAVCLRQALQSRVHP